MILIVGGTTEGRIAAQTLDAAGSPFFYSTKGELQRVSLHNGVRLCGAMDSASMREFCMANGIRAIVDAAHPFALGVHETIHSVYKELGIGVIRYERQFPRSNPQINWCKSYSDAVERLKNDNIKSLLALTGVNTIARLRDFWEREDVLCHFRVLDRVESRNIASAAGFPVERLLFFDDSLFENDSRSDELHMNSVVEKERELIRSIRPQAIITKESGESGYFNEKVRAALECGVKVYTVRRPELPQSFVPVYGPVGLRLQVERMVKGFFPLRIGLTTGSTATAATRGAVRRLLYGEECCEVHITLPQGEVVAMPVVATGYGEEEKSGWGIAVKYSGDDPDITGGHEIISTVKLNETGDVLFYGGTGVGVVTLPGLGLEVGGPAINNGPRSMMKRVVEEELGEYRSYCMMRGIFLPNNLGMSITISVPDGVELAKRTFNPKVGIVGGISIIGTSGVVRPFSKEAFINSISREMDVAKALGIRHLVINSGAKSEQKVREMVGEELPSQAYIHYGNFIGETIRMASEHGFERVTMGIMIGKAVKLAAGNLDTHSRIVTLDRDFIQRVALESGCRRVPKEFRLARELWDIFDNDDAQLFFARIKELCLSYCAPLFPNGSLDIIIVPE